MKSTKKLLVAAVITLLAFALGACGGGQGSDSAGSSASGGADATTIKLVAAEYSKSNTKAFWDAFAKTYKDKTGYTLDVQVVPWDSIDQQSSTMIQNGQAPDILNLNAYASYAKDGLLYSSDEVLSPEVKSDILDNVVKYGTYDGKFYGFPDLASARALFYNTDVFAKAGIAEPPKTWDELAADAEKVTAGGDVGYAMPLGPEESQAEFSMWLFNNGGNWKTDGKWSIDSAPNLAALEYMKKLADDKVTQPNPGRTNRADAFDLFKSGKAGMVVGFSPLAADLDKDAKVKYAVAPFPSNTGGSSATYGVTDYLMAFKKEGNQKAVKAFYDLYYQKDQINTFIKAEGFLPVTKSGVEFFSGDTKLKPYLDTMANLNLTPTDDPTWDKVKLAVQQNLGGAITGDPAAVLGDLQKTAENGG